MRKRNGWSGAGSAAAWALAGWCAWAAWGAAGAERPRVEFDRAGGFTVQQGEAASVTATLEGGSGGMWFSWEGNNGGTATGEGGATFEIDTGTPGEFWLKATGGSDGTDGDFSGKIRFRVAAAERTAAGVRAAGPGETLVWSEDFSELSTSSSQSIGDYHGWSGEKCYNIDHNLRIGSSSAGGNAVSTNAALGGEAGRLEFSMWYHDSAAVATLQRSTDGGTTWVALTNYSGLSSSAQTYSVEVPASSTVAFRWSNSAGGKRFYLDDVALYTGEPEANQPPTIDLEPEDTAVTVMLGETYELEVTATDYDGDTITLGAGGVPTGATWVADNPGTGSVGGAFEWTPETTGTWTVAFSAADKDGTNTVAVAITVVPEGAGVLSFASASVNARESGGSAVLTVLRTGGATGTVTVAWATANGTATAGSDYTAGSGTLTFAPGQTSATLAVGLLDDTDAEANKTFTVSLGATTGGATLGDAAVCTVTIVDDDDANTEYYASCYKNGVLKTGDTLKDALCQIINTGVTTNTYGSNLNPILNIVDACPTNSNQVLCIYLQRGLSQSAYNKEHIWPQSHGCSSAPPQGDLHHLRACDSTLNSTRGNKDFDTCQGKSGATEKSGCYYTSSAWEPPDAAKGDIARAVLYMDVRYENKYNGKINLTAVDSTGTSGNQLGKLSTLIAWNEADPPDDFERRRNELIYTTYQGNRNPFIDHPTWVRAVFDPSNFVQEALTWTVNVTVEGAGWVNGDATSFTAEATNGTTKTFFVQPDAYSRYHIGNISWNGTQVPQAYYTNASYYNYTTPAVTNTSTLAVVFAADTAALGTPLWWLEQYGTNATSVAGEDWDAAELEDWNDDGTANWQEYVNGTDPTAFSLRQVTNVAATAATADGFTLGWDAVTNAGSYRVRVCSTAQTAVASAGFEGGSVDSGWSTGGGGTTVGTAGAMAGSYALAFATNGAWLCSPAVANPASVEFLYKRSTKTNAWTLVVEVSTDGGTEWKTAATVDNATESAQTCSADLTAWRGETVLVRLRDARESGAQARYVDAVTVWNGGATVAEGTSATTNWTATGLDAGTTYGAMVRAEATVPESAAGPWSAVVPAATATDDSGRTPQTITFPEIADQVATNTVALGATASSGLAVAYAVVGNATESGGVLAFTGDGSVTVTASQAGNEVYAPAASVSRTFTVTKAAQSIAWAEIGDQVETATVALSAAATSGGAVTFAVASGNAVINGSTLSFTGTGSVTVTATQAGGALWSAASTSQTFAVEAVELVAPAGIWASATNSTEFTAAWSAVAGATGYELSVWTVGEGTGAATTNEMVVLSTNFTGVTGSSQITSGFDGWTYSALYASNAAVRLGTRSAQGSLTSPGVEVHGTLRVVTEARKWTGDSGALVVEVDGESQSNTLTTSYEVFTNEFEGLDGWYPITWRTESGTQRRVLIASLEAVAVSVSEGSSGVAVPVAGYEERAVAGTTCSVTGLTASTEYRFHARATAGSAEGAWSETAAVTTLASSGKNPQSIAFPAIADQIATNTVVLGATATSGLPVTYAVAGNATESGGVLAFTGAGTVTVTASQAGNEAWEAAASVTRTFAVEKAEQDIDFTYIVGPVEETATVALSATAMSGLPVTFVVEEGPAVLDAATGTLTFTGTGEVTVTARQAGNALWEEALPVWVTFQVVGVELPAPAAAWASATNAAGFTAAWSAVTGATEYELTVWQVYGGGEGATNETVLLAEDFAGLSGNGDTSNRFANGAIAGWTASNTYIVTNELRVGTSKGAGWVAAPVTATGGGTTVRVVSQARSWGKDTGVSMVLETGGLVQTNSVTTNSAAFTNDFAGLSGALTVKWSSTAASKRYLLESVRVMEIAETEGGETATVVPGYDGLAVAGTEQAVTGLVAETTYEFQVLAMAGTTAGAGSEVVEVTTLAEGPVKQAQSIAFAEIGPQVATNTVVLGATASSGLAVSYSVTGPAVEAGGVLTFTGAGTVTVTASQAGDADWEAAESVTRTFAVSKAQATVALGGLEQTYDGQTHRVTVATEPTGLNVAVTYGGSAEEPTGAGSYAVAATVVDGMWEGSAAGTLVIGKAAQSIAFGEIGSQWTTDTVALGATASSGLSVGYVVSGPATLDGTVLSFTGEGTVSVTASQGGDANWAAAADVTRTFAVSKKPQTITFGAIADQSVTDTVMLDAMVSSGLPVTYTVSGPATLDGTTLSFTGAGTVTVTAHQAGNEIWSAASDVARTFTVSLLAQTIDFPEIAAQVATNTVTLSATASSGLDVTFTVESGPATLDGNTLTFTGAGTVVVTASQSGGGNYAAAADVTRTFAVTLATQEITFGAIADQSVTDTVTLEATASSGLGVSYTVSGPATLAGTTLSFTGAGEVTVTAHQAGNAIWAAASDVAQTFSVSLLSQTIDFPEIAAQVTTNTVTLSATATSGLDVTFAVASGPATLSGNTLTFTGAGSVVVTASQAGGGNYAAATDVTRTFAVTLATQEITFGAIADQSVTDTVILEAMASSGLAVSYTVSGPATLTGSTLSFTGEGTVTVTAHQTGNAIWAEASDVARTFTVSLLAQTIDFPEIAAQVATNSVSLSATATSGLTVTFTVASGPATLDGNTLTFTGAGTVVVTASQSGGGNYAAAADVTRTFAVTLATQEITFGAIADQSVTDTVTLDATASSGLTVSYTVSGPATLTGATLSFTGEGTVTVTAHQAGNAIWAAASDVAQTFSVSLLAQTIDFPEMAAQEATNTVTLSATATSGLNVTFAVASGPAVLDGNTLTFTGAGTVVVTASQTGGGNYAAAADVSREFTVTLATQEITFGAIADQSVTDTVTLGATASSGLPVNYTVSGPATLSGTTLNFTNAGTVTVTASQPGNALYAAASDVAQTFTVSLLMQSIDFPEIAAQVATNTVTLSATATSGLDVTFAVTSGPAVLDGNTLTFTGAGTVVVTASQAGGGNYAAAADVSRTFAVSKAQAAVALGGLEQTYDGQTHRVTVGTVPEGLSVAVTYDGSAEEPTGAGSYAVAATVVDGMWEGGAAGTLVIGKAAQSIAFGKIGSQWTTDTVTLGATASSGLAVGYAVSGPATLDGTVLSFTGEGTVSVTASQGGDANWAAAESVTRTFAVSKKPQSITFAAIADQSVTDTVTLDATASSGLAVSYAVSGPAALTGNVLTFTGAGTVTVTASQSGNGEWASAQDVVRTFEVSLLAQTIDFPEIAAQVATNMVTLSATATSGLTVTFAVASGPATLDGNTLTFTGAGTVVVTASQSGGGNYAAAADVTRMFAVTLVTQEITFGAIADQSVTDTVALDATASSGLAVSYTVSGPATLSGTTLSFTGAGTVTVTASQGGNALWAAAEDVARTFEVVEAAQAAYVAWLEERNLSAETEGLEYESATVDDYDGDGASNWQEYLADTDPADGTSRLTAWVGTTAGNGAVVRVVGASERRYYSVTWSTNAPGGPGTETDLGWGVEGLEWTVPADCTVGFGVIRARLAP